MKFIFLLVVLFVITSCSSLPNQPEPAKSTDEFLWLEEVQGPRALGWVENQNARAFKTLKGDPRYPETEKTIEKILASKDRIPEPRLYGNTIYNHWTDEVHPRGLWRRCSITEYRSKNPKWEILLDLDELGKKENESWVFKGVEILQPQNTRAFIRLSRGGKDAVEIREFDLEKKQFIKDGFFLPEAKSDLTWIDEDTVLVATNFGPGSLTQAGYPRIVKKWQRGKSLNTAKILFEGQETDTSSGSYTFFRPEGNFTVIERHIDFYDRESHFLNAQGELKLLPLPRRYNLQGLLKGKMYFTIKEDWQNGGQQFKSGSLLAFEVSTFLKDGKIEAKLIYKPDARSSLMGVTLTKSKVWLEISKNVKPSVYELQSSGKLQQLTLPEIGTAEISAADTFSDELFVEYSDFLTPPSLYSLHANKLKKIKSLPAQFDSGDLLIEQFESTSKDGTHIPYFVVRKKSMKMNSQNPTLLNAYGGFEISMTPGYYSVMGKTWLSQGGIYVLANIRGGGEFGPLWHQAALKENRQRAFDDFFSVAEDIMKRQITSPSKLAITGGSNGGLLMGAAFTQRPELFKAVICEVPLLDMLRYNKLLSGASWMGEYGNPDIPSERSFIEKYSPYQNMRASTKYPDLYFTTSTKDDRVHPGHARKMAALFEKMSLPFLYFENTEGGHGAAADLKQKAQYQALKAIYLMQEIMD